MAHDIVLPTVKIALHDMFTHALTLRVGDEVDVTTWEGCGTSSYKGPGIVSRHRCHYDSHLVWLDHAGLCVNVMLENGNAWLYPALAVQRKATG